jgi:hypothetical protein
VCQMGCYWYSHPETYLRSLPMSQSHHQSHQLVLLQQRWVSYQTLLVSAAAAYRRAVLVEGIAMVVVAVVEKEPRADSCYLMVESHCYYQNLHQMKWGLQTHHWYSQIPTWCFLYAPICSSCFFVLCFVIPVRHRQIPCYGQTQNAIK